MTEGRSFYGSPKTGSRRDRWIAALVIALLVVGVGVAIAKPWGSPAEPAPPSGSPFAVVPSPAASTPTTTPQVSSPAPSASIVPLPVAFTTPRPPASATWTGLNWRRLAPDDPLTLVTSVVRWRHGFVALGWIAGTPSTPVWTSTDGRHWEPLPLNDTSSVWPGLAVVGLGEVSTGLVALTEEVRSCSGPCPLPYVPPVVAWTSADGRVWTLLAPVLELGGSEPGQAPLSTVGPAGLVIATSGSAAHLLTSTDGSHWRSLPTSTLPATFWLNDLRGTPTGYVAVGRWSTSDNRGEAASLWSADGQHWSPVPTLLPTSPRPVLNGGSTAVSLVVGRNGMVGVGDVTAPGAALWWQSSDGRRWQPLRTFAPLGPTTCTGFGCGRLPNGVLVGDGNRMVAVRGGADAGAWTSTDGRIWSRLRLTGDIPSEQATQAVLLPGGILLSDGTATWFGQAQGP